MEKYFNKENENNELHKSKNAKKILFESHLITTKSELKKSLAKLTVNQNFNTNSVSQKLTNEINDHGESLNRSNRRVKRT